MNRSDAPQKIGSGSAVSSSAKTRLSGSRLILARAVWLALVVPSVGLFVASLPVYYTQIQRACVDPVTCNITGTLTAKGLQELLAMGLSASSYAALLTIFFTIIVATWSGVGFLIFWRRSDEWFALFSALFLVIFNTTYPGFPISALALAYPGLNVPITLMGALGIASVISFLVLFPNGRLVPRWMGLFLLLGIIGAVLPMVLPLASSLNSNNWPGWVSGLLPLVVYGTLTVMLALVYFGLVIGGQHLLVSLLGQSNAVVLVVSTLIVAALFQPLRQRIQRTVDRRFYRSKYDAAKIVAAFSATLRQEVDLDQLREHLLAVVQETMQPAHISLWLRPPEQKRKGPS